MLRCDGQFRARYRGTPCAICLGIITRGLWIYGWTAPGGKLYTHVGCITASAHRGDLHCADCWHPMLRAKATWDHVKRKRVEGEWRCSRRCSTTAL